MPVVDIHTHVYPQKIAAKAVDSVGEFYLIDMKGDGTVEHLVDYLAPSPITHNVIYSVAVKPSTVESINNFIADACSTYPNLIGFAAMHQDYPDPEAELTRAMQLGLRGIKMHPDTQQVNLDDPRLMTVYEIAQAKGLPVVLHTGDYRYDYSHPRRLKRVLKAFPDLVVDAAHFGGWSVYDLAVEFLEDERCFMDMSSSMFMIGDRRTRELVQHYGTSRILFGSDFPMWDPISEYERFTSLGFSDAEYEDMCWHNAERFLGMEIR